MKLFDDRRLMIDFSLKNISPEDILESLLSSADKLKQHFETRVRFYE
jgi:hypothetical protein